MKIRFSFHLVLLLLTGAASHVFAQGESTGLHTIYDRLTDDEGVELTLETDLTTFIGQKKTNNYMPGVIRTKDGQEYQIEVRPRGRYRRKVSQIPPMKIRFTEDDLRAEGLDTLNEIKVALPCFDSDLGNELIVREYLTYKLFETISDAHFKARLVKLSIHDTYDPKSTPKKMYAIFIEDEEEVAARLGLKPESEFGIPLKDMDTEQAAMVIMFQYLIGNTDWEFAMHRNVELFHNSKDGKIIALPYDFDFSGLVSAPYAVPSSDSGLKSTRDRFLMSGEMDESALKAAINLMKEKEEALYEVCRSEYLSKSASNDMRRFLGSFFKKMKNKDIAPVTMKLDP
ncbi:MAG: CotH kinase family protein [Saprospiraceae bacterium]|nr:CotH kinase family protein [Saprospiraceae bacterium]